MAKTADSLHQVAEDLASEGLHQPQTSSRFVEAIMRTMPDSPAKQEKALVVASGLQRLLARHHDDSKRIIAASVALGEASEYEVPAFVTKLGRFMRFLESPVASHSLKNIKLANFVSKNPDVLRVKEVDSISVLGRLPEGSFSMGSSKDEIWVGGMSVHLEKDDLKKVNQVVKKFKADVKAKEAEIEIEVPHRMVEEEVPARRIEGASAFDEAEEETDDAFEARENDLPEELSQAERALSKVLGRLSSESVHPQLSQVLEEARKYLRMALREGPNLIDSPTL